MGDEMSMHAEALKAHPGRWLWDSPSWNPEHRGDWWVGDANGTKIVASVGNAPWQVARLIARAPRLASEVDRLSADLADALRRAEEVAADNARLVGEAEAMKARVAESQNETLVALGELNRARGERDALKAQVAEAKAEAERRTRERDIVEGNAEREIDALRAQLAERADEAKLWRETAEGYKAELAEAEKDRDGWCDAAAHGLVALRRVARTGDPGPNNLAPKAEDMFDHLAARLEAAEKDRDEWRVAARHWEQVCERLMGDRGALRDRVAELEAEAASLRDELAATRVARDAWHAQAMEAEDAEKDENEARSRRAAGGSAPARLTIRGDVLTLERDGPHGSTVLFQAELAPEPLAGLRITHRSDGTITATPEAPRA